ncbi:hypothetical protein [Wenyingzhuangia sp. 2_MG-2023]|uniref:hypothetical protein n=1 Tax=Wenyingzhuangia sp. 2_MG-2023 TaxID=3062639 RepID=UPI0026E373AD|nr:hypothetical protein [Wenyingzhuangia sp. 2_MG-2023]MDO6736546.1 hypothetical protein [Wenyingzhuangia sp. 2_MG-2023]
MKFSQSYLLLFLFLFLTSQNSNSQDKTILNQFDELYKKSSTYEDYKVVKIQKYNQLKTTVVDSLQSQQTIISEKNQLISNNNRQITELKQKLSNLENELNSTQELKDSRSLFGIPVSKFAFSLILFFSHTILIILLAFFAYKYKENFSVTSKAVTNLKSLEEEFEDHKKSSLKRFQEVNRKLQDELNKQWRKEK